MLYLVSFLYSFTPCFYYRTIRFLSTLEKKKIGPKWNHLNIFIMNRITHRGQDFLSWYTFPYKEVTEVGWGGGASVSTARPRSASRSRTVTAARPAASRSASLSQADARSRASWRLASSWLTSASQRLETELTGGSVTGSATSALSVWVGSISPAVSSSLSLGPVGLVSESWAFM